ncbi:MAG: UDP-N-acetylglucosamine acyltransferase [Marinoscillum sp.]|jgi:UDP-N-acetylglucosamine acyltransferase
MISPLASVSSDATIGQNVTIEAFTVIEGDVAIGDNCRIGPHVTIMNGARIGSDCKIFPNAVIAAEPQDLKFQGEETTATIGNSTIIRECVTINRGTKLDRNDTLVGSHCIIMAYTHVAHDCVIGDHVILANNVQMAGHVHIGDHAFIGGSSAIHQHVMIGRHAMISGGSLVRKDVPPFITAAREPLCYMGINTVGLERKGFNSTQRTAIHDIYQHIYTSGQNMNESLQSLKSRNQFGDFSSEIISFIERSIRGTIGAQRVK